LVDVEAILAQIWDQGKEKCNKRSTVTLGQRDFSSVPFEQFGHCICDHRLK
jgi:hypothetical protein